MSLVNHSMPITAINHSLLPLKNLAVKKSNDFRQVLKSAQNNVNDKLLTTKQEAAKDNIASRLLPGNQPQVNQSITDLEIKKLAVELQQQFYGFMWSQAFPADSAEMFSDNFGENTEGTLVEEKFRQELITRIMADLKTGEMTELSEVIYNQAKRRQHASNQ